MHNMPRVAKILSAGAIVLLVVCTYVFFNRQQPERNYGLWNIDLSEVPQELQGWTERIEQNDGYYAVRRGEKMGEEIVFLLFKCRGYSAWPDTNKGLMVIRLHGEEDGIRFILRITSTNEAVNLIFLETNGGNIKVEVSSIPTLDEPSLFRLVPE